MKRHARRILVAIVGGIVLVFGIILIPYPGPGWLVVFAGLGLLSTEFDWAKRVLDYARGKYDAWAAWVSQQNGIVKSLIWLATALVVVVTVYLLNGYGFINNFLHLGWDWLKSPFFK